MTGRAPRNAPAICTLNLREAAAHIHFTASSFLKWVKYCLLQPADASTGKWQAHELDVNLGRLRREGHLPCIVAHKKHQHFTMPNVHSPRKENQSGYNGFKRYYYFRPTGDPIAGSPGSPEFMTQLIDCERRYAARQKAEELPSVPTAKIETHSPALVHENPPSIPSDTILQMGGATPSYQMPPLYASETEIGVMVLGPDRAHEWPALAARLEGLPPIDAMMGGRFRPSVQAFFEARHGLDGGLTVHKHVPKTNQRSRIAVTKLQVATQLDPSSAAHPDGVLLTAEELCERWRWQITPETLANHRSQGTGVPYIKVARQPLYALTDVEQFEQQRRFPKPKP